MNLTISRAGKSRLHLAILEALRGEDSDDVIRAYAENIAFSEYPEDAMILSRAIDNYTANAIFGTRFHFVCVDTHELENEVGTETCRLALSLCGFRPKNRVRNGSLWTDAPSNERTLLITLPATLLNNWNI